MKKLLFILVVVVLTACQKETENQINWASFDKIETGQSVKATFDGYIIVNGMKKPMPNQAETLETFKRLMNDLDLITFHSSYGNQAKKYELIIWYNGRQRKCILYGDVAMPRELHNVMLFLNTMLIY